MFPILVRIAQDYKQALYYPYQLSRSTIQHMFISKYADCIGTPSLSADSQRARRPIATAELSVPSSVWKFDAMEPQDKITRQRFDVLGRLLEMKFHDHFVEALENLTTPELKAAEAKKTIDGLLSTAHNQPYAEAKKLIFRAQEEYKVFYKETLSETRFNTGLVVAKHPKNYGNQWRTTFQNAFDEPGKPATYGTGCQFTAKIETEVDLRATIKRLREKFVAISTQKDTHKALGADPFKSALTSGDHMLKDHSSWLADFEQRAVHFPYKLELPGQYSGDRCPQPETHVTIVNFNPNILIMSSIRKPKRITIHASDEKNYNFLVKGLEDLRLDQRIEQLFGAMNKILATDSTCCTRAGLSVRTYQVIPVSQNAGLLEWVSNTIPVKSLVSDYWEKYRPLSSASQTNLSKASEWFSKNIKNLVKKGGGKIVDASGNSIMAAHLHAQVLLLC